MMYDIAQFFDSLSHRIVAVCREPIFNLFKIPMKLHQFCLCVLGLSLSLSAHAWTINPENSSVNFTTIKKTNLGETHRFTDFSGNIDNGRATIVIKPDSIDSRVPIRDERMREFLFKTEVYPTIEVSADVTSTLTELEQGTSTLVAIPATLAMHGVSEKITLNVRVDTLSDKRLSVSSSEPVLVRAATFNMVEGIQKLSSLVNGLHITESVPVSFSLVFEK